MKIVDHSHDLQWTKSSACNSGTCFEVALVVPQAVYLRDSANPDGPRLRIGRTEWANFVTAVRSGALSDQRVAG